MNTRKLLIYLAGIIFLSGVACELKGTVVYLPETPGFENATGARAHWLKQSDLTGVVKDIIRNGEKAIEASYTGSTGVGIVMFPLKSVVPSMAGARVAGLRLDIEYDGEASQDIEYFISFKDGAERRGRMKLEPGRRFYDTLNSAWKNNKTGAWDNAVKLTFFLREFHFANTGKTPVWRLYRITTAEEVVTAPLTAEAMLPMNYAVDFHSGGIAILPADEKFKAAAEDAIKRLENSWQVKFSRMEEKDLTKSLTSGNYLMFSDSIQGPLLDRMIANSFASPIASGYELRSLPNLFVKGAQFLYIAGAAPEAFGTAVEMLSNQSPRFENFLATSAAPPADAVEKAKKLADDLIAAYEPGNRYFCSNTQAMTFLDELATLYYRSHDPGIILHFRRALAGFIKEYPLEINQRKKSIPYFHFYKFISAVERLDDMPGITAQERLDTAELIRWTIQQLMPLWSVQPAVIDYQENRMRFYENHTLFAGRSIILGVDYLNKRCNIPHLDYFRNVALHSFAGTDSLKIGPEDAGGYQFICRMHWMEISQRLGLNYDTPNLRYYNEFVLSQINQMGYSPSYGDENSFFGGFYGWNFLLSAVKLYNDRLSAYMLAKQAKNVEFVRVRSRGLELDRKISYIPRQLGLTVFPLLPDLQKYYKIDHLNLKNPLNKAVFRNGFEPDSNYLALGGMNSPDPHSHRDANGILQYSRGSHYWLIDRGYDDKTPYFQNVLQVAFNHQSPDLRQEALRRSSCYAEIDGTFNAPEGQGALSSTTLYDYAGVDWARNIFWTPEDGFWIIDTAKALNDGNYVLRRFFRAVGEVEQTGSVFKFTQKPSSIPGDPVQFVLSRGDSAPTLYENSYDEDTDGYKATMNYPYASYQDIRVIRENFAGSLKQGETQIFADFFSHPADGEKSPQVIRLAEQAFLINSTKAQLAVLGKLESPEIQAEAAQLLIASDRIIGRGVKFLKINGKSFTPDANGSIFCQTNEAAAALFNLGKGKTTVVLQESPELNVPTIAPKFSKTLPARLTAMSATADGIVAGCENGAVVCYDREGNLLWEGKLNNSVISLCSFEKDGRRYVAAGSGSFTPARPICELVLFDANGKKLWTQPSPPQDKRQGAITCIGLLSRGTGQEPILVCGQYNDRITGWDLNGKKLWDTKINHGACSSMAIGDFTGDGRDEAMINERWRTACIVNTDGKLINRSNRTVGYDRSAIAYDVDGSGRPTAIFGNDDGFIRYFRPQPMYQFVRQFNAGGRPLGLGILPDGKTLVAGVDNNAVNFFDFGGAFLRSIDYPCELIAMAVNQGQIITVDAKGVVYFANTEQVEGKFRLQDFNWSSYLKPIVVFTSGQPVAGCFRTIHFFK